jgi:hypothetical protein
MYKSKQLSLSLEQHTALEASLLNLEAHYHSPSGYARIHVIRSRAGPSDLGEHLSPNTTAYRGADAD